MARKTLEQVILGAVVAVAMQGVIKSKKLSFTANIGGDDLCDVTGKVKKYADVDTLAAGIMSYNPLVTSIVATLAVAGLRNPRLPNDPIAEATTQKARYVARLATATANQAKLAATLVSMASYENSPNASLVARFNEVTAEKTAVDELAAFFVARIAEQDAIINPPVSG